MDALRKLTFGLAVVMMLVGIYTMNPTVALWAAGLSVLALVVNVVSIFNPTEE
jgi:hypothetical protein